MYPPSICFVLLGVLLAQQASGSASVEGNYGLQQLLDEGEAFLSTPEPQDNYSNTTLKAFSDTPGRGRDGSLIPSSEAELRKLVEKQYLKKLPSSIHPSLQAPTTFWVNKNHTWRYDVVQMDLHAVRPEQCKPVIKDATQLATGLWCSSSGGCKYTKKLTASKSYSNTVGAAIAIQAEVGFDVKVFQAKVSTTHQAHYDHSWTSGQENTDEYEFSLANGESCTPKMVHVDLDCELSPRVYWFDGYARWKAPLRPEWVWNRKGGPYRDGQYCREMNTVNDTTLNTSWKPFIPSDLGRGYGWTGESTDWHSESGPFPKDTLVIRRKDWDSDGDTSKLIVCDAARTVSPMRSIVPYGDGGKLAGFIACLSD